MFWHEVTDRVIAISHILQDPKANLHTAVAALTSLQKFIEDRQTRNRPPSVRMNPLDYGRGKEAQLSPAQKFRVENFLPVIDQFVVSIYI